MTSIMQSDPGVQAAPSTRVAVAYVLRGEAGVTANRLRARHDPRSAAVIPAHLTLAGPANVTTSIADLLPRLQAVAAETPRFDLRMEAVATFLPVSATAFLEVSPWSGIQSLHDRLLACLGWGEAFPYHPHVTIAEYLSREETARVYEVLRTQEFQLEDCLDRLSLFEKQPDGRWELQAEFSLSRG